MATQSSILAQRISFSEEPGGLQSTGSQSQTQLKQLLIAFEHIDNCLLDMTSPQSAHDLQGDRSNSPQAPRILTDAIIMDEPFVPSLLQTSLSTKTFSFKKQPSPLLHSISFPDLFILFSFITVQHMELEKAMAAHSSTLAWKIPWTEEPGRLQSMGSHRVGHN